MSISEGDGEYCALSFHRIHLIRWLLLSSYVDGSIVLSTLGGVLPSPSRHADTGIDLQPATEKNSVHEIGTIELPVTRLRDYVQVPRNYMGISLVQGYLSLSALTFLSMVLLGEVWCASKHPSARF